MTSISPSSFASTDVGNRGDIFPTCVVNETVHVYPPDLSEPFSQSPSLQFPVGSVLKTCADVRGSISCTKIS